MPTINDLFTLQYGHSLELNRLEPSNANDAINYVSRSARNNGVTARVRPIPGLAPMPAGTISVALNGQGGAGVAFLQPYPYYTGFHIMVLTAKKAMSEREKLWWVMCITANRFRFGFGRQANRTLKDLLLPEPEAIPEWVNATNTDRYDGVNAPQSAPQVVALSTHLWQKFKLADLFEIRKGGMLKKSDFTEGDVPYISASSMSNGQTARVGQKPNHAGGTISVSHNGSIAEAFFQPVPFWASGDINVLYPRGFTLTPAIALFLCTIIRQEKYRYNYGRKWRMELMRETVVGLPAGECGTPDFEFMERYIKSLPYSSQIEDG